MTTMTEMTPIQFEEGQVMPSLYLQMWPEGVIVDGHTIDTKEDLQYFVEESMQYGLVSRIDVKKNRARNGSTYRSAFIHFHMISAEQGRFLLQSIDHKGEHKVDGSNKTDEPFQNKKYSGTPYFVFRENINPVRVENDDEMSLEQAVERCKRLEESLRVKEQEVQDFIFRERRRMQEKVDAYHNQLCEMSKTIYSQY
jgi:hypothetical protein